jgi:hypothetical protein
MGWERGDGGEKKERGLRISGRRGVGRVLHKRTEHTWIAPLVHSYSVKFTVVLYAPCTSYHIREGYKPRFTYYISKLLKCTHVLAIIHLPASFLPADVNCITSTRKRIWLAVEETMADSPRLNSRAGLGSEYVLARRQGTIAC